MTLEIPSGYITRPNAAKLFNRSQSSLERDLEDAYKSDNEEVLSAFKLATNDGKVHRAQDVSTDLVKQFQTEGMNPAWCASTRWLEETYGLKGEPKPKRKKEFVTDNAPTPQERTGAVDASSVDHTNDQSQQQTPQALQEENEFLKERIRMLEQEKRDEASRSEKREDRLYAQLEVKDRQIESWDEITQGLTRGLATGQLTPVLLPQQDPVQATNSEPVDVPVVDAQGSPSIDGDNQPPKPLRKSTSKKKTAPKPKTRKKSGPSKRKTKSSSKVKSTSSRDKAPSSKSTDSKPTAKKATSLGNRIARFFR